MSYCRWGTESNVYVFGLDDDNGKIIYRCQCCALSHAKNDNTDVWTPEEMIAHLEKHRAAGHKVPDRAIELLKSECGVQHG
jgi:hypothetical protein